MFWASFSSCQCESGEDIWTRKWRCTGPVTQTGTFRMPQWPTGTFSRRHPSRTSLCEALVLWKSELQIARVMCCCCYSFCCLNSLHIFAADCQDPEIAFANSSRAHTSEHLWKSVLIVGLLSSLCAIALTLCMRANMRAGRAWLAPFGTYFGFPTSHCHCRISTRLAPWCQWPAERT